MKLLLVTFILAAVLSIARIGFADPLNAATGTGHHLLFTDLEVPSEPLLKLSGVSYENFVAEIRKQNVVVLVMNSAMRGADQKLDRRSLNTASAALLAQYELFYTVSNRGVDSVGAMYLPPFFDHADNTGSFAKVERSLREKPIMMVARNGSITALFHEYTHHLVQEAAKRAPVVRDTILIHPGPVEIASNRTVAASINPLLQAMSQAKDETAKKAIRKNLAPLDITAMESGSKVSLMRHGEEMDITSLLLDNRQALKLPKSSLTAQAAQFVTSYRALAADIAAYRGSDEWKEVTQVERDGDLSAENSARKIALEASWKEIDKKLAQSHTWFESIRLELLKEVEREPKAKK